MLFQHFRSNTRLSKHHTGKHNFLDFISIALGYYSFGRKWTHTLKTEAAVLAYWVLFVYWREFFFFFFKKWAAGVTVVAGLLSGFGCRLRIILPSCPAIKNGLRFKIWCHVLFVDNCPAVALNPVFKGKKAIRGMAAFSKDVGFGCFIQWSTFPIIMALYYIN